MAEYKEIADLNPVSVLNGTDQFVVQTQKGAQAQRVSVDVLSSSVADNITAGSLAELQTAVSLGKNALAQRLTEKGAPSSSTDSLITMADKLHNLPIDNDRKSILGAIVNNASLTNISGERSPFNFRFLNDGYVAVAAGPTLFLIPPGKYENIEAACQAQVAQINFQTAPGRNVWLGRSRDGNTLIAWTGGTTFEIYDVNYQIPALTFIKEISEISVYEYAPSVSISNDRSLFAWYNAWGDVRLAKVDNPAQFCKLRGGEGYEVIDTFFDEDNCRVFSLVLFNTSRTLYEDVYTVTDEGITSVAKSLGVKRGFFFHQAGIIINCVRDDLPQFPEAIARPKLQILELKNNYNVLEIELPQIINPGSIKNNVGALVRNIGGVFGFPVVPLGKNKWQLFPPGHGANEIIYDASEHRLTKKYNYVAAIPPDWGYDTTLYLLFSPWLTPSNGVVELRSKSYSNSWTVFSQESSYPVSDIKFLGQERIVNGKKTYMVCLSFPKQLVQDGYYDVNTKYVELKAAEEEQ